MAEEAFRRLEEQLECSICLATYTNPKILPCFHVNCKNCLVRLVIRDQQGQLTIACPTCRQVTSIPDNGVAGLTSAFHINHLLEIQDSLRTLKSESPTASRKSKRGNFAEISLNCPFHDDKELELYCETCGELVCLKCVTKGGKHCSHNHELVQEAYTHYKAQLMEPVEKQLIVTKEALVWLDTRCGEITNQQVAIEAEINETARQLHAIINSKKNELMKQLNQITQEKLRALAAKRDQTETTQAQVNSCLGLLRASLQTHSQGDVLMMKTRLSEYVEELTTAFKPHTSRPNIEADMMFLPSVDTAVAYQDYGNVLTKEMMVDSSKCYAKGMGVEIAVVGEKSTATLQAVNHQGKPCEVPIKALECELVSQITGTRAKGYIQKEKDQYEIRYQPTVRGRNHLNIKIEGRHIRGSPFSVAVKSPDKKYGVLTFTINRLKGPFGVAVNQRGEVVISEGGGGCISVFSPSGTKLQSFSTRYSGQGLPGGVAIDGEGNVLVTDRETNCVQKFTMEGKLLVAVGTKSSQFCRPNGIARNNKVYVTNENHRIHILNSDLTPFGPFGKYGNNEGHFKYPHGVACDSTGKVYVTDSNNHRIQVFTAEGKFLGKFGKCGEGKGEMKLPAGIAIDTDDIVYVSESENHRISVFNSEGQFLALFGQEGSGPTEFKHPHGLALDRSGVLYVCDRDNYCVKAF